MHFGAKFGPRDAVPSRTADGVLHQPSTPTAFGFARRGPRGLTQDGRHQPSPGHFKRRPSTFPVSSHCCCLRTTLRMADVFTSTPPPWKPSPCTSFTGPPGRTPHTPRCHPAETPLTPPPDPPRSTPPSPATRPADAGGLCAGDLPSPKPQPQTLPADRSEWERGFITHKPQKPTQLWIKSPKCAFLSRQNY